MKTLSPNTEMFSKSSQASNETKIAVLEERLTSYEVMLEKIDEAIQIMGKTSLTISKMLAVHEEKLENNHKNDDLILDRIKSIESKNTEEHTRVIEKISSLEERVNIKIVSINNKIDEISKFRWIIIGAVILLSFIISNVNGVVEVLTPDPTPVTIEKQK